MQTHSNTSQTLLGIIAAFSIGFGLYSTKSVMVPVLFGVFLAVLVQPLADRLSKRLPYWLSVTIALAFITIMTAMTAALLVSSVASLTAKAGEYSERFDKHVTVLINYANEHGGLDLTRRQFGVQENVNRIVSWLGSGVTSFFSIMGTLLVVLIIAIFSLAESHGFNRRIIAAFGDQRGQSFIDMLHPIGRSVQQYLWTKTLVSLMTGLVAYLACLAIGIDFAFLWGVLVFLLNYLPYFGSILATAPPILITFLQYDEPTRGFIALGVLGTLQFVIGNIIEPQILGRSLRISSTFLFVSMLFWGWFWGLAGIVLAIPLTAALVIAGAHYESLRPLAMLLVMHPEEAKISPPGLTDTASIAESTRASAE